MKPDIYEAIAEDQIEIVTDYITKGYNVNENVRDDKYTPLHVAVQCRNLRISKLLIDAGSDVNAKNYRGDTPLNLASEFHDMEIAKLLMNAGANGKIKSSNYDPVLHTAVRSRNFELSKLLVTSGADLNEQDQYGKTALYYAVFSNNVDITKLLVDAGADASTGSNGINYDEAPNTAVEMAIQSNNIDILNLFVNSGVDFDEKNKDGNTPLQFAIQCDNFNVVKLLLEADAEMNEYGVFSSLQMAISSKNISIFKLLMENDPDLDSEDSYGNTPLHTAAEDGDSKFVKMLLDAGACVHAENNRGLTSLHKAVYSKNMKILKLIIDADADVNAVDNKNRTPLHHAAEPSSTNIVKVLLEAGADVNAKDKDEETPLHKAVSSKNVNVLKLLIKNNALVNVLNKFEASALLLLVEGSQDFKSKDQDNVEKTLRLLLKYTDINLINDKGQNMLNRILLILRQFLNKEFFCKIILELVATIKILNFQINPSLLKVITHFNDYNEYFTNCTDELVAAKNTKLCNSWVTFFNLLVDDKKNFVKYAGNEDLVKDFEERVDQFPIYGAKMKTNVMKGVESRKLFDGAADVLTYYLPIFNPTHLIIRDILDVLSKNDWNNFSEKKRSRE